MKLKTRIAALLLFAMLIPTVQVDAQDLSNVSESILERSGASDLIIRLNSSIPYQRASLPHDKEQKGIYVYQSLVDRAERSQADVLDILDQHHKAYTSFVVANVVWVHDKLGMDVISEIARLDQVAFITENEIVRVERTKQAETNLRVAEPEWGITHIHADSVWRLGFRGQGVVVGGQDTGYEWDHPAISHSYRGNKGGEVDHNYSWYDAVHDLSPVHNDTITNPDLTPCGISSTIPCDDSGHGTHTMGTIVGEDGDNLIGLAPEARWVGVRCMDRGYGSPMTYLEAFEWFLAPTDVNGQNPDPTKAPHVINNSWRCPEMEGCNPENFAILEEAVHNLRAAGVVVVVSAGNEGGIGCGSVDSPPAIFAESFSVGAIRPNDTIAGFSSRGPVMVDSSGRTKPDIAAPGTLVRSAWLDSTYRSLNGTSMAGPHVAGTVALMISANPDLAGDVEKIEEIIRETARRAKPLYSCDSDSLSIPNNTYGYGIIDALAAVEMALETTSVSDPLSPNHEVTLFPNPSAGRVNYIIQDSSNDEFDIRICDMRGSLMRSLKGQSHAGVLDLTGSSPGIYAVVVRNTTSGVTSISKIAIGTSTP